MKANCFVMEVIQIVNFLILIICVLIGVAFVTLLERKILGFIQIRKGPNKVGFMGLLQPFSDAVKLFTKEQTMPTMSNFLAYYLSPIFSLFLALLVWLVMPYEIGMFSFNMSVLFFFCCLSLGVYSTMVAGWSSNCKYSLLGSLRAVAQTISYEVSLALILLSFIMLVGGFSLELFNKYQENWWFMIISIPLSLIWFSSCLAETNRTPFDFAEGESELVSGFNTEYSSGGFALIFMAEYASILFMSVLFVIIFLGSSPCSAVFYFKGVMISFMFVWVRGTLPRFRYDKLMHLAWKSFLPTSINYLIFFVGLKALCFSWI
uniref:NADH-ubiquinone oxidoreductase chain 1 n=2 Tax=Chionoecetes TaxID=41209 RepID=A0A6M4SRD0_CHIOP|nr:NADH dehydrogenase subunit 1 [Chionoecetes bairdi]YP_010593364.1 NADH dehydrogenase subunit 1 [Chionoecetes opilio x Chionoecetes japonicus]QJS52755.1 NADH dehydrogenase subunit 1 [Chionoecetes opilio]UWV18221.1 NADH dehydrogenase subunit 1 [Chionoecetes opilio x Chionoecetes japonicus]UYX57826.1 NADH dehydrogenase subunit 1 [Chionoecetes bairdi]WAI96444.1 NADH dehydrogenase subunit 1 [Chionoecetes opilio x Chionoecetes japonicus]